MNNANNVRGFMVFCFKLLIYARALKALEALEALEHLQLLQPL
jgi:hypothetical protein